jgi:hypothetical protein
MIARRPELTQASDIKRHVWTIPSKQGRSGILRRGRVRSCVDDPVEARAIWYVAPRSGAVMCPAYVARPYDRWP